MLLVSTGIDGLGGDTPRSARPRPGHPAVRRARWRTRGDGSRVPCAVASLFGAAFMLMATVTLPPRRPADWADGAVGADLRAQRGHRAGSAGSRSSASRSARSPSYRSAAELDAVRRGDRDAPVGDRADASCRERRCRTAASDRAARAPRYAAHAGPVSGDISVPGTTSPRERRPGCPRRPATGTQRGGHPQHVEAPDPARRALHQRTPVRARRPHRAPPRRPSAIASSSSATTTSATR